MIRAQFSNYLGKTKTYRLVPVPFEYIVNVIAGRRSAFKYISTIVIVRDLKVQFQRIRITFLKMVI